MVCVAEKGSVSVELSVDVGDEGAGHASTPPTESAIGILSAAIAKLEKHPMPTYFTSGSGPARDMFASLASSFSGPMKFIMGNLWFFGPLVKLLLSRKPKTAAVLRTTTAVTVFHSGQKVNVLPRIATAQINHRIHPNDTIEGVVAYDKAIINDDRIKIRVLDSLAPSPVSSHTSQSFQTIRDSVLTIYPQVSVVPALMIANTGTITMKQTWFAVVCL